MPPSKSNEIDIKGYGYYKPWGPTTPSMVVSVILNISRIAISWEKRVIS